MQFQIIRFDSLESTNDQAADINYHHGDIVLAENQTAGRGQRGNKWNADCGLNLTFSLIIEPEDISVFQQFRISEMAALAASDAIRALGVDCKVKWPNDLYVDGRKIGGILIEHTSMGPSITKSIVGIGINVNQQLFDPEIPNPVSLINLAVNTTPDVVLEYFIENFATRYAQNPQKLHSHYIERLWGGTGRFRDLQGEFEGQICNIDQNSGVMSIRRASGVVSDYYFKEVEFLL